MANATRAEVLAAYVANPKASFSPTEDAIAFWQDKGLGNFNQIVDEARAQNPALAAQIDTQRAVANRAITGGGAAVTGGVTGGGVVTGGGGAVTGGGGNVVDNSARYRQLVLDAYSAIGRKGIGTAANQADQAGVDFWTNALINGTLTPATFNASFNRSVGQYITENPTNLITQNVNAYKPFANTGLLSQSQMQPQSVGAPAVPTYQPQSLAQNFQNYMGIPIGAQYNPAVTTGGTSPYSQIKALTPQFVNPYAGVVANTAMGGYNPMLYEQVKAAARAAGSLAPTDYLIDQSTGGSTGGEAAAAAAASAADSATAAANSASGNAPGSDGTPGSGAAQGGLITRVFGPDPAGPDEGQVNMMRGEYVIKKSAVDKYGKGLLDMINEGKVPVKKAKSLLF